MFEPIPDDSNNETTEQEVMNLDEILALQAVFDPNVGERMLEFAGFEEIGITGTRTVFCLGEKRSVPV